MINFDAKWLFAALAMCSLAQGSESVLPRSTFNGYDEFYASLGQSVFIGSDKQAFQFGTAPSGRYGRYWQWTNRVDGTKHVVEIVRADIFVDGKVYRASQAQRFPGGAPIILGSRAQLYANDRFVCVQGVAPSASGTAVRHVHVSLIVDALGPMAKRYELPSLFGSCLGVLASEEEVGFSVFAASYRSSQGGDISPGLVFKEFALISGVIRTGSRTIQTTFTDPDNVYVFSSP